MSERNDRSNSAETNLSWTDANAYLTQVSKREDEILFGISQEIQGSLGEDSRKGLHRSKSRSNAAMIVQTDIENLR